VRAARTHTQALARKSARTGASPRRLSNGDEYGRTPRAKKGRAGRVAFCRRASLRAKKKYLLRRLPKAVFFCRKKHENGGCVKKDEKREKRGKRRRKRRKRCSKGGEVPILCRLPSQGREKERKARKIRLHLDFCRLFGTPFVPFFLRIKTGNGAYSYFPTKKIQKQPLNATTGNEKAPVTVGHGCLKCKQKGNQYYKICS